MTAVNNDSSERLGPRTSYSHLFRLLHWPLAISLPLMVATGLSLHATARPGWSLFGGVLPAYLWPARVHLIHLSVAVVFSSSLLAVSWIYAREKRRRRATHLTLLIGSVAMILSAVVLLNPVGPAVVYSVARLVHGVVGLAVLPVAYLWHVAHALGRYRRLLWPAFHPWARPRWLHFVCFIPVPLVVVCLVLSGLPMPAPWRELLAKRIPLVDPNTKHLAALPWNEARSLRIELANGVGFDRGRTRVTLKALHDGRDLFVSARWADPVEDRRYMPWKKTPDGWEHLVSDEKDESRHYEDKFALVFPTQGDHRFEQFGCATYCHLGGGRAYGYKGTAPRDPAQIVDVWHWKSTRVDPVGQVDDKYWSEVDFSAKDVGRHGDPKEGGGYQKNFSDGKAHPDFLPRDASAVKQGIIFADRAVEYTPEAAASLPAGTIVPGIVASAAQGDRGDVGCQTRHENGHWQLYIRRTLDTRSQYDVRFLPGRPQTFGCAAFDHSSKRHAYNLSLYRLVLEE